MRVFTCTPVAFGGGPDFFARDSGLLCRGLRSIGIESRAVMPGERRPEDEPDLIRTGHANLESSAWWRSLELDGLVLYAWGSPKYRKVARAIREAGIRLVLNQDNGGLVSPRAGFRDWLAEQRNLSGDLRSRTGLIAKGLSYGLLITDPLRAEHLRQGDVIACVSPTAAEHYRRLCRSYGGGLESRIEVLPHAVEPRFRFDSGAKERRIACLGRWDDVVQKRPELLMRVVGALLREDERVEVSIAGATTDDLARWHAGLPGEAAGRVEMMGRIDRDRLAAMFRRSRVFYSPSAFESFGIAAAEALCCGCSVVAGRSVSMSAFEWFVSAESGSLADPGVTGHVAALKDELDAWDAGMRNGMKISQTWSGRLHADQVARAVVEMVDR